MSNTELLDLSPRTADTKGLYREMFNSPLRGSVQRNAGRVQQAGKKAYCHWYLARDVAREGGVLWHDDNAVVEATADTPSPGSYVLFLQRGIVGKVVSAGTSSLKIFRHVLGPAVSAVYQVKAVAEQRAGSFVDRAKMLDQRGQADAALDLIYDHIDALLRARDFARVDVVLDNVDVRRLSPDLLLGLLTATLPARTRLGSRRAFFRRVEERLKLSGDWTENLLAGLES